MGTYRLMLAIAVMLYHAQVTIAGRAAGVVAVVSFYIISGYVMTALVDRHYSKRIGGFYVDRAMRLFPQYLFYLVSTQAVISILHPVSTAISDLTFMKAILNASMIGLGVAAFHDQISVMPQTWSLGVEWQFYLLFPFLLRARRTVFVLSLLLFAVVFGFDLHPITWAYATLPGVLFMFLFGSFLYRNENPAALWITYAALCVACVAVYAVPSMQGHLRIDIITGLVLGVPAVHVLGKFSLGKIDAALGNMSYGVFLNHFAFLWILQTAGISRDSHLYFPLLIGCSLVAAWASYEVIEKPVIKLRHAFRDYSLSKLSKASSPIAE